MNLTGVIDMHIHTAPDLRPRPLDDIELAKVATSIGVRAVVIKNHIMPTAGRALLAEKAGGGVKVFGGIVLNPHVGGINPIAVEAEIEMGGKIVWLPTLFSQHHRQLAGKQDGVATVIDDQVVPSLKPILDMIARHNLVLATGHLSPREIFIVVNEAQRRGVGRIVITHPEISVVNMSFADQLALAENGVYFERCYAQPIGGGNYKVNLHTNAEAIDKIGYKSTIIATDSGQLENPLWNKALVEYLEFMESYGISQTELDVMSKINPAKLLDLSYEEGYS
jgi:hypothetical protein